MDLVKVGSSKIFKSTMCSNEILRSIPARIKTFVYQIKVNYIIAIDILFFTKISDY